MPLNFGFFEKSILIIQFHSLYDGEIASSNSIFVEKPSNESHRMPELTIDMD